MRRAMSLLPMILVASLAIVPVVLAHPDGDQRSDVLRGKETVIDLSSRAGINRYLTSIGVDPGDALFQRGDRNYAGPNCPGKAWTCADTSGPVVQISSGDDDDGDNVFVCNPAAAGTDAATNTCVIVQVRTSGTNKATCTEKDEQDEGEVTQSCDITQENSTGKNIATVLQSVVMEHDDTSQRSEQRSEITQVNGKGSNNAKVTQGSNLTSEAEEDEFADVEQVQDVIQDSVIDQETGVGVLTGMAGSSTAAVVQTHRLEAEAEEAASSMQRQNADDPTGETSCGGFNPNICAFFDQHSTNGKLLINLRQVGVHRAEAENVVGDTFQQQGSSEVTGGIAGLHHQDSTGLARRFMFQTEIQIADAGDTTQIQFTGQGPRLNSDQVSHPDDIAKGDQTAVQIASDPTLQQLRIGALAVPISGTATFHQFGQQNDASEEQTITGGPPGVFAELGCTQGDEGTPTEPCFAFGGGTGD